MKVEYKSMFLGVALGVVGVFTILFLLGDVETEFSFTTGESANLNDKNIDVRIEKTIENGEDLTNVVLMKCYSFQKTDPSKYEYSLYLLDQYLKKMNFRTEYFYSLNIPKNTHNY